MGVMICLIQAGLRSLSALSSLNMSLAKEVMFLVVFVCLSSCKHHYSQKYEQIAIKSYGRVWDGKRKTLNCGGDLDLIR